MVDKLVEFILESRKRGFSDESIKTPLVQEGWSLEMIEEAFEKCKSMEKTRVCINLDSSVVKTLEKRAKKNLLGLEQQIEEIVRRSCANSKRTPREDKTDDKLLGIFSRSRRGRKKKAIKGKN